jgi:small-conductance mechanosensitive channel
MHLLASSSLTFFAIFGQIFENAQNPFHKAVLGTAVLLGAIFVSLAIYIFIFRFVLRRKISIDNHGTLGRFTKPAFWLFLIAATMSAFPAFTFNSEIESNTEHALHICLLLTVGWLLVASVYAVEDVLVKRYDISAADNLNARRIRTQMAVIRRLAMFFIFIVIAGLILYTFNHTRIWQYGAGLIASAGLASFALASAAKTTVGNLLAGIQIALTEPIRIDDVVIVDGQWGRIEEITSAYVVVRIWNLERLIVPLTWFIENPFQNWTRTSADLLGTFYMYVDYTCPVEPLREEFANVLKGSKEWDGKAQAVQLTDFFKTTMQIRFLMSAGNSGDLFNLRCYGREKMIAFVQKNYPQHLPTLRFADRPDKPDGEIKNLTTGESPHQG